MVSITPKQSTAKNAATGQPYTAVGFSIDYSKVSGTIQNARPCFYDPTGAVLPSGAIPLVSVPGQSVSQLQAAESTEIALAMASNPTLSDEQAAKSVIVPTRGVVLA